MTRERKQEAHCADFFPGMTLHKTDGGSLLGEPRGGLAKTAIAVFYLLNHSRFTAILIK